MECYRIEIPAGVKVAGAAAGGQATHVLPGEYLVHRYWPKLASSASPMLRFVGADPTGRDVHVPLDAVRGLPASTGVGAVLQKSPALDEAA